MKMDSTCSMSITDAIFSRYRGEHRCRCGGDVCATCGTALHTVRAVETGNIFWIGTHYSDLMGATFSRGKSTQTPVQMGSYRIGIGRLLACIAEEYNDDDGLTWPITVAPFQVHLVSMRGTETEAEQIYADLLSAGIDVLFDDRDESPGVKFNDADLIGVPLRITVGKRALQQRRRRMKRRTERAQIVPLTNVVNVVQRKLRRCWPQSTPLYSRFRYRCHHTRIIEIDGRTEETQQSPQSQFTASDGRRR